MRTPIVLLTRIRFVDDLATFTATVPLVVNNAPSVGAVKLQLVRDTGYGCPPAVAVEVIYIKPFVIGWLFVPDDKNDVLPEINTDVPATATRLVGFVALLTTLTE